MHCSAKWTRWRCSWRGSYRHPDYWRAAQLTGAYDVLDAALVAAAPAKAYQLDPSERKLRDNNQARLRKTLGEEQFERAYTTGTSLSLERACDLALGKTNPK